MSKYTSGVTRFDGHSDAPVQFWVHCPMKLVQGFIRSHWTLPLGKYLLHIIPGADRAQQTKQQSKNVPYLLPVLIAVAAQQCTGTIPCALSDKGESGLQQKPLLLVATIGQVLRPIIAISQHYPGFFSVFSLSTCWKGGLDDFEAPNDNRGMTYQTDGKELSNFM